MRLEHHEWRESLRFAVTGVFVAAIYFMLFPVMKLLSLSTGIANMIAFLTAVLVQYLIQSIWTFRRPAKNIHQARKFAVTILIGLIVSSLISLVGKEFLLLNDWWVAAIVVTVLPVINYLAFKLWVFNAPDQ